MIDAVPSGGKLKINAYAAAGKTSTLRPFADRLSQRRGIYLAFNREIAEQARRSFPANVSSGTIHSLAYRSVSPDLAGRVGYPPEPPHELAARFGLAAIEVPLATGKAVEPAFELGRMVADSWGRFCRSADAVPAPVHVPIDEKIDQRAAGWLRSALHPYVARL